MSSKIMVINDTQEILELFAEILQSEGYEVSLHSYSTRELDDVRRAAPDLIISDHPPFQEEKGWQFVQKLKMSRDVADIPVIICTTSLKWLRANVDEGWLAAKRITIVPKPFNVDELLQEVRVMLDPGHARATEQSSPDM
jgi:DNA-binding response OmpR family regulator